MVTQAIRQALEEAGESWIDENVFIYEAPSLGAGHRFARRVVRMLRSGLPLERGNLLEPRAWTVRAPPCKPRTSRGCRRYAARGQHGTGARDPMTIDLGAALEAFILEHEHCGDLDAGVEDDRVWMTA